MYILLGLLSVCGLSLFFARQFQKICSLMPLLVLSFSMLWFMLWGMAGQLFLGGILWYALTGAALIYTIFKEKTRIFRLFSGGFVFFVLTSLFFCLLFFFTKPMLSHWDEFTFWGTAAKAVSEKNALYTVAQSNLVARSYPPGLILNNYMLQFFSPFFSEQAFFSANAIFYMACIGAAGPMVGKNSAGKAVFLCGLFFLPFVFETMLPAGQISTSYIFCLADPALAFAFGGALCFYFSGVKHSGGSPRLFVGLAVILSALCCIKDIGFAFALLVLLIVAADMFFCNRKNLRFTRLKGGIAGLVWLLIITAAIFAAYLLWAVYMGKATGANRFDLGSGDTQKSMFGLISEAAKAFLGIEATDQFTQVNALMWRALYSSAQPVSLFGSALNTLIFSWLLLIMAWLLSLTKAERRRIFVFGISGTIGFLLFYLFNIFTYSFIFAEVEALALKDFHRYIYPYLLGFVLCCAAMLAHGADTARKGFRGKNTKPRIATSRVLNVCLAAFFAFLPFYSGKLLPSQSNFLGQTPSIYTQRQQTTNLVNEAKAQGMQDDDVVYLISQHDDGTSFYMLSYEMEAELLLLYGTKTKDEQTYFAPSTTSGLSAADGREAENVLPHPVQCSPQDLGEYLEFTGATHVLVDKISYYILSDFADKFDDGLEGWTADAWEKTGRRYYEIIWQNGDYRFAAVSRGEDL